jgi:hypothetical protein
MITKDKKQKKGTHENVSLFSFSRMTINRG